ncbi:MAG: SMP-30/gluconolactonase/LRE family protein [Roseibium sp.]|uniref:SMP-30/gluconolactonase/LRE family protein n=1 Tax=Roseibium sp. TaxID=1936156 RepID=UPI001B2C6579|nr:SMP-30/gluconolactonase/LRE family protein [Roseibium sp.]MBO6893003.1 SMP-30/gluconolactonase/LRE family protein [Roseibium sp.]MBO6929446.1 SMP-30/gluconolactonase/LRE family protein [Roseibium sp.]
MENVSTRPAHLLVECQNLLGEGVQWNDAENRLYWTDIFGTALWSCDEEGQRVKRWPLAKKLCAFAFREQGPMLGAFADGLYNFDPKVGTMRLIKSYQEEFGGRTRMNDGHLDRAGRFLVGGIDEKGMQPITPVWSVSRDKITTVLEDVGCANSISFSPDGRTLYFADSRSSEIRAHDYDPENGSVGRSRSFARLSDKEGKPDGSCVDASAGVWNAQFGGGAVQRFNSDGARSLRIEVAVPNVTCCAIGGKNLDRLFITTARLGMSTQEQSRFPLAGGLFACDIDWKGLKHGTYTG